MTEVMANKRSRSKYTADESAIVATIWLYLVFDHQIFSEVVCIWYPMRDVADTVVPKDTNVKAVRMLSARAVFALLVNPVFNPENTVAVVDRPNT